MQLCRGQAVAGEQFSEYGSYIAFLHSVHNAAPPQEMQSMQPGAKALARRLHLGRKACTIAGFTIANQIPAVRP